MVDRKKKNYCITLDEKTKELIDRFAKSHSLSRSAVIRLAVSEFFIKNNGEYTYGNSC
jgi:predicted transcriptional regulator